MFARVSNLLPVSTKGFDPNKQLTRHDVEVADNAVVLGVRWTKTIQHNERQLFVPL